jgi:sulfite reductase alpha subunit-like flavoprotein
MKSKICRKCGVEKPIEAFYLNKSYKDGRLSTCNTCKREVDLKRKRKYKTYRHELDHVISPEKGDVLKVYVQNSESRYGKFIKMQPIANDEKYLLSEVEKIERLDDIDYFVDDKRVIFKTVKN